VTKSAVPLTLEISRLRKGYPCLSPSSGTRLAQAAAVCLERQLHAKSVVLKVQGDWQVAFTLKWQRITDQMRREWGDPIEATENGACAIAILLVDALTDYHIVHRAYRTTGIDYWLCNEGDSFLTIAARLEVSGIARGLDRLESRVRAKLKQTTQSDGSGLPAFVVVVEFDQPVAAMRRK